MSYMTIFWNDNVLDQKAEINTVNSYASILKFAKALVEKIKHFQLDVKNIILSFSLKSLIIKFKIGFDLFWAILMNC